MWGEFVGAERPFVGLGGDDVEAFAWVVIGCGVGEGEEVEEFLGRGSDDYLFAGFLAEGRCVREYHAKF
jgi:hypothetical protein